MSENGKGSKKRPRLVSQKTWDENYEKIFKKKLKIKNHDWFYKYRWRIFTLDSK